MNRIGRFLLLISFGMGAQAETPAPSVAVFAGGCFWCMQPPYDQLQGKGVIATRVGYAGGRTENPTYEQTSAGNTGHLEVIEVAFDPKKITYQKLLDVFWVNVDPFDGGGQFCDKGQQYTTAIFYANEEQKKWAEESKAAQAKKLKREIVTPIVPLKKFYVGEDYHQDYYRKNPIRYKYYRSSCGRDKRLKEIWGRIQSQKS